LAGRHRDQFEEDSMQRPVALAVAAALAALAAGPAAAQQTRIGSHAAYHFDVRQPALGGQLEVPLLQQLELYPSAAYFLVDRGSLWAVNADLKYRLLSPAYLGAGLNLARRSVNDVNDTDAGVNLLAGVQGRRGPIQPFMEGRVILNSGSAFQLAGGLNIALRS
jgi:opacity protein-like surface antigen